MPLWAGQGVQLLEAPCSPVAAGQGRQLLEAPGGPAAGAAAGQGGQLLETPSGPAKAEDKEYLVPLYLLHETVKISWGWAFLV